MTCENGHDNSLLNRFCGVCGVALQGEEVRAPLAAPQARWIAPSAASAPSEGSGGLREQLGQAVSWTAHLGRPKQLALLGVLAALVLLPLISRDFGERRLTGTIETPMSGAPTAQCFASSGYSDIEEGAQVTVLDRAGTMLGLGELSQGSVVGSGVTGGCEFSFVIDDLPRSDFYTVDTGNEDRGGLHYSREELGANNWHVALTLND